MVSELRAWTDWSSRCLADVLHTTHTTILNVETGRPVLPSHSGPLRRRIADAHDVIDRVHTLVDRNPATTADVMQTQPSSGRPSAMDELRQGNPARAYLAAIDVVQPRQAGLLVGRRPRQPGGSNAALHD